MKIKQMVEGTNNIFLLAKEISERETKTGKKYLLFSLTDGIDEIQAKQWDNDMSSVFIDKGDVVNCSVQVGCYNGSPDYVLKSYMLTNPSDNINVSDFVPTAPIKSEVMYQELLEIVGNLDNNDIKQIVSAILISNKEKLLIWSAAKLVHHNLIGGLLYHMYRMTKTAVDMTKIYDSENLNKDLVIAGTILHDIGKLGELETDSMGNAEYTVLGELLGHSVLGSDLVKYYGSQLKADKETVMNLRHIILSHHGKLEYGAVVVPKTIEAKMVSEIDMIDSQIYQYEKEESNIEPGMMSEKRTFGLDGKVYRPKINAYMQ